MNSPQRIPKAFVSYKSANKVFAKKLAKDLRRLGIQSWFDEWNLPPGKPLSDAMETGITASEVMLLLLSRDSVRAIHAGSGGVAFEVHIGEGRRFSDSTFRIIGVYLEECDPPEKLRNRIGKWIDFTDQGRYEASLAELAAWIKDPDADLGPPVATSDAPPPFRRLVRVSPDGSLLATTTLDGSINIVHASTKELLLTLRANRPPVDDMQFSPDARTLYATDQDGALEWILERGQLMAGLRESAKDEVAELEELLHDQNTKEVDIQRFLEQNPHILGKWGHREVYPHVYLAREQGYLVPDFILLNEEDAEAAILELKAPRAKLMRRQINRDRFADAILEARAQLLEYRDWFDFPENRAMLASQVGMEIYRPKLIVVAGRDSDFKRQFDRQKLRSDFPDIEVVTYDDILRFARKRSDSLGSQ